jgi:hypothetical protein
MSGRNLADYIEVKDRIAEFWKRHPEGRVLTRVVEYDTERVLLFAEVYTDREDARPAATGYAEEVRSDRGVNATSAVENGETSAIGRALANMGMALSKHRASREEMEKVERHEQQTTPRAGSAGPGREAPAPRSAPQRPTPPDRPAALPRAAGPPSAVTPAEEARLMGRLDKVDAHYNAPGQMTVEEKAEAGREMFGRLHTLSGMDRLADKLAHDGVPRALWREAYDAALARLSKVEAVTA